MNTLDCVDNANNLITVVRAAHGPGSKTESEVKRLMSEGHDPKDIASELAEIIKGKES